MLLAVFQKMKDLKLYPAGVTPRRRVTDGNEHSVDISNIGMRRSDILVVVVGRTVTAPERATLEEEKGKTRKERESGSAR